MYKYVRKDIEYCDHQKLDKTYKKEYSSTFMKQHKKSWKLSIKINYHSNNIKLYYTTKVMNIKKKSQQIFLARKA